MASNDTRPIINAQHEGPIVLIFLPTFLCPAALLVISTILVRLRTGAVLTRDWTNTVLWDYTGLITTLVITIAWTIVVCLQTSVGLGDADPPKDQATLHSFEKHEYAAQLLYLLGLFVWKSSSGLSNSVIYGHANPHRRTQSLAITGVVSIAFIAAIFACAFQCDGPQFWALREDVVDRCFDQAAYWITVGIIDIISEILIHGTLIFAIASSQIAPGPKRTALTIIFTYLATYTVTVVVRLVFVSRPWNAHNYPLVAAWVALATFSQLIFPPSVLCIGKIAKFLDMDSYLSPAIGAQSRKKGQNSGKNYYWADPYGNNSANITGPGPTKGTWKDSVEELPLRMRSKRGSLGGSSGDNGITVTRDVDVGSERGNDDQYEAETTPKSSVH